MKKFEAFKSKKKLVISSLLWFLIVLGMVLIGVRILKKISSEVFPITLVRQKVVSEESNTIEIVEEASPSVVSIIIETVAFDFFTGPDYYESGIGTGFIVDKNGIIVTNSHVVDSSGDYSIVTKDGESYPVEKIHLDPTSDIAILEVVARDLPVLELGDSDNLKPGQQAIAIGNALGKYDNSVTTGVISGISREVTAGDGSYYGSSQVYENVIQTDAALNPGNSGGPLLNSAGQVIGINVATTSGADNISFAIPINNLKPILNGFLKEGRIIKPYLGVVYVLVTPELSELRNLPEGFYITRVVSDSPASEAGLQRGDIIMKINDSVLGEKNVLANEIAKYGVGEEIKITIDRDGEELNLKATLIETPDNLR